MGLPLTNIVKQFMRIIILCFISYYTVPGRLLWHTIVHPVHSNASVVG